MSSTRPGAESGRRRVVLTGFGVISSIGIGAAEFTESLRKGRSGVSPISVFDVEGFAHGNGCEVKGFEPEQWITRTPVQELGRASRFAVAAARMAVQDAGLDPEVLAGQRGLVSVGTTDGESFELDQLVAAELADGPENMDPEIVRRVSAARLSTTIAQELGLSDIEAPTIATACSAGNYAIGYGFDAVSSGEVDFALCGGADAMCRKTFTGFYRLGTIAPEFCQPFDADRKGILTGEGAGVLVLESLESALARNAVIYAEVLGYGLNCDAYHQVAPKGDSVAECMRIALENAGVKPQEVDLISAHGTGTKANDITEAGAIREVFAEDTPRTISLKSMLGHTMGAASALGAIACGLAITHGFIPPTINHRRTDPECDIDCVPNEAVEADLRIVQNNGLAFGGNNSIVILGKYEGSAA
ncbi:MULTISPECIES: beta-ketoacyl-[acyl-carrier-protein] synthase family protein [Streptomyces]|uniref:beta-ketoacyl-[acyl-carrier-protein] synthase family protein n=1 Tax=Streptomyces TaxID=1883 RepID=UPI00081D8A19|nr:MULTISPECIES: beta-ketoacyl-[acyl-carrier-protein] synthase family protein [Streptomyces]OSC76776.1 3-oxoacyl-ACP synthase [Streptomyces sp. BF-3]KAA6204246.1 beta-ketoacyl-[acyl-carrier-protein] synthase family protein [Streptomyces parvus]PVC82630.1 beta-ketoacyl-[acyl-carrier-protein] synthase family protein [Streptomyces sp. CS131]UCA53954.1 beta-ketoacyl-[acyl-carrier-protein] synthase family protein [Streptomyces sp. WA6-1-16]SCF83728.1 3-oxoacyl-[acyl-carrier-protein] synthase II [St